MTTYVRTLLVLLATITLSVTAAYADDDGDREDHDHDQALELYEHGEIRSLADILRSLGDRIQGEVVDVVLYRQGDRWTYRLTLVSQGGERTELAVDASTMAIVEKADP